MAKLKKTYFKFFLFCLVSGFVGSLVYIPFAFADEFARPDSNPGVDWVNEIGCPNLDHWQCLDETVRDDSDYIESVGLGKNGLDTEELTLSDISDPLQSNGHFLRYTIREGNEGTNPVGFEIDLLQGTTVIATFSITGGSVPTTFTLFQHELTPAQADSITDYTMLNLELRGTCDDSCANSPSARERLAVSWIEFAVETSVQPPVLDAVTVQSQTSLQLFWTEPLDTSDIISYQIFRDDGAGFNLIDTVSVGTTTYVNSGLTPDTTYTYRLESVGTTGNSVPSNEISQTTTIVTIPPDYARPDSDPGLRWVNGVGCPGTDTYICVDEIIRDDTDYVESVGIGASNPDSQTYTFSNIEDPIIPVTHVLRYTMSEADEGTNPVSLTVHLRQGPAVLTTFFHGAGTIPNSFVLVEQTIPQNIVDLITDYNNLELEMIADCDGSCGNNPNSRERIRVSWIEFEILFPVINLQAEEVFGKASLIEWEVPIVEDNIEKYVIKRSENSGAFVNIIETPHDSTQRVINSETGRQFFQEIDTSTVKGNNYVYEVYSVKNQKETIEPSITTQITIPDNLQDVTFIAEGSYVNTTGLTPLSDDDGNPIPVIGFDLGWLIQDVHATHGNPLFTSSLNPKSEPHLVELTPIPNPMDTSECQEILEIHFEKSQPGGQDFTVFATILENQTIIRTQDLVDHVPDSNKRIFQEWSLTPTVNSTISSYNDLSVQLDVSSTDDLNPLNHRQLSVYEVKFIVPESSASC